MISFFQKNSEKFRRSGLLLILYALLIETILLLLLSFSVLFTLETILPGLISGRFVIGKLIIGTTLLIFSSAFLGHFIGITFPTILPRLTRPLFMIIGAWILCVLTISLLSFPLWSIPILLLSFGAIGYFFWRELEP